MIATRVMKLTRNSSWTQLASVPMKFATYHPQGMVKVGGTLLISSVEVKTRTEGVGHLFKSDLQGNLIASRTLGEGSLYHPGGIDYDGKHLWVPVGEYRPDSRSIVYRVDPATLDAIEVLRVEDHIGAVALNTDDNTLHGVSWGSRRFYRWTLDREGRVTNASAKLADIRTLNASHYIDYQDCKYVGGRQMLCTGVAEIRRSAGAEPFRLGGMDIVNLADGRPVHQAPILLWTPSGLDMTHNPVWVEPTADGLRAYFLPEDDRSTLYIFEVSQP